MSNITIIDYGYGNIFSLISALKVLGYSSEVSNDPEKIKKSKLLVLPGVGAFRVAMDSLVKLKLDIAIKDCLQRGGKILAYVWAIRCYLMKVKNSVIQRDWD